MIISFKGNTGGGGGYVLPTATASRLGGIKVGSGLTVQNDGTLSADGGGGASDIKLIDFDALSQSALTALYTELNTAFSGVTKPDTSGYKFMRTISNDNSYGSMEVYLSKIESSSIIFGGVTAKEHDWFVYSFKLNSDGTLTNVALDNYPSDYFQRKLTAGTGIEITSANTINCTVTGGTGGGDYIVTEALSSITNPTEGMIAYVPAHYEDRGATHIKFELIDTSENVDLWYPDFLYFDNDWNKWEKIQAYYFDATNNENSRAEFRKDDGFRKSEIISSDAWFSPSLASQVLIKVSGATIEFLVDSGLTISGTQNPDDKFNITISTGLTPVRGMTYVYHSGWILKDVDFAYDRFADYMPSCLSLIKNRSNEQELGFGLWGINFDTKYWFNIDAEGQPLGWGGFSFSCLSTEDDTQIKYEMFVETDGSSWNPNARVTNMKPLDLIRIPVLAEDAVLTEDIEYEGQIVAHSGDTVATAGTILAETDLYNVAAYGHDIYGKNRVIFVFVQSGDCSWNSEQQKVIVNEGPGLEAYGDLQNIHRVAVEGEPEDYYISATMDYNGTLYRGSWKQHDRYTRWITLSWEPIMNHWVGTQAQYDALAPNYDNNTLYLIIN